MNDPHCLPTFEFLNKKQETIRKWPDITITSMALFPSVESQKVEPEIDFADNTITTA